FWDVPESWPFIRGLQHPDAQRQAFLRAGSARVVLTIRKGWEEAWVRYAQGGFKHARVPEDHPYMTIAREIAAYDDRNYPGIPPANPGKTAERLEDAVYTTSTMDFGPSANGGPVTIAVESTDGFTVGRRVVIDIADDKQLQEAQLVIGVTDKTH